jgi:hypothetical protein
MIWHISFTISSHIKQTRRFIFASLDEAWRKNISVACISWISTTDILLSPDPFLKEMIYWAPIFS